MTDEEQRHRRELHIHCYRMLASFDDAEDAVQDAFLRAWRYRDSRDEAVPVRPWLYRIATNACLDLIARDRKDVTGQPGGVTWPALSRRIARAGDEGDDRARVSDGDSAADAAMALDVFRIEDGMITEIMTFSPSVFEGFGLPSKLKATSR